MHMAYRRGSARFVMPERRLPNCGTISNSALSFRRIEVCMNEQVARDVVLIRAIETTDRKKEVLTEDDRLYASRSARELAQWQAADSKSDVTADHFLQQRADLLIKRLSERSVPFKTFMRRGTGWRGITIGLPMIALLLGAGIDRIGDPHRVDLLSAPLLGIHWLEPAGLSVHGGVAAAAEKRESHPFSLDAAARRRQAGLAA